MVSGYPSISLIKIPEAEELLALAWGPVWKT